MSRNTKRITSVSLEVMLDRDPDTSYLEQAGNEDRLAQYRAGGFYYWGIQAVARVVLGAGGITQIIRSGGLWGIESDSAHSYFDEVAAEEMGELRDELRALGFSARTITVAFKSVNKKEIRDEA